MSYGTRLNYNADGTTNIFSVSFPYIDTGDVVVLVDGIVATGYTFPTSGTIQLGQSAASLAGALVQIQRQTQSNLADVTFQAGPLDPNDLNTQALQLLYIIQELQDSMVVLANGNFAGLPTVLPSVAGVLWNNGGVVSIS